MHCLLWFYSLSLTVADVGVRSMLFQSAISLYYFIKATFLYWCLHVMPTVSFH